MMQSVKPRNVWQQESLSRSSHGVNFDQLVFLNVFIEEVGLCCFYSVGVMVCSIQRLKP